MFMTEEEAREKWCPFTRVGATRNRFVDSYSCIGARCAAWRWSSRLQRTDEHFAGNVSELPNSPDAEWLRRANTPDIDSSGNGEFTKYIKTGYCGLGGRPE